MIFASVTSGLPVATFTSMTLVVESSGVRVTDAFSTVAAPFVAVAVKTFGRRVNTFVADFTLTSVIALPAYTGRVAIMSPPSTFSAVQSAASPASNLTATLGAISFPI